MRRPTLSGTSLWLALDAALRSMCRPTLSFPWLALGASGCGPGLADPVPWLELPDCVEAELLPDVPTPVGVPVRNVGTATAFIRANATGEAELNEVRFRLAPGDATELLVILTSDGYASTSGDVNFLVADVLSTVPITGRVPDDVDGDGHDAVDVGGDDCDDLDPLRSPSASEVCNGLDDDCDDLVDEELPEDPFWFDGDDDGYGDPAAAPVFACEAPDAHAPNDDDCDDDDPDVSPAASERWYDGFDENCDGHSDFDQDFDGVDALAYGGTDCDDEDATVYPEAPELDDQVDNDCDSYRDEDVIRPGDLVFTEVFVDPVTGIPGQAEWVELHNVSGTHADLSLLRFSAGTQAVDLADEPVALAPDGVWLVCREPDPALNGGVTGCGTVHPSLPTGVRTFTLQGPDDIVDAVDATGWALQPGRSLELASDRLDAAANDDEAAWCAGVSLFGDAAGDRGTPGVVLPPCP